MDDFHGEFRTFGRMADGKDPWIKVPETYCHYLGLHVHMNEFKRIGVLPNSAQHIDPFLLFDNLKKRLKTERELIEVYKNISPENILVPEKLEERYKKQASPMFGIDDSHLIVKASPGNLEFTITRGAGPGPDVGEHGANISGRLKGISERDVAMDYPFNWQELWLNLTHYRDTTTQVEKYIAPRLERALRAVGSEEDTELRAAILSDPGKIRTKEYIVENGRQIDLSQLRAGFMPKDIYTEAHKSLVLYCHDVMIEYDGGLILVQRDNFPANGILWPIGGRVERGMLTEQSLRKKVKAECGLDLEGKMINLGCDRTLFETDPFGHGRGTDTINARYFAQGLGEIKLDALHSKPTIVRPQDYTPEFRSTLHPYVQDFMDVAIKFVGHGQVSRKLDRVI